MVWLHDTPLGGGLTCDIHKIFGFFLHPCPLPLQHNLPAFLPFLADIICACSLCANEDAEAALLEDVHVVVVGVAHGPARRVLLRLLRRRRVDEAAVAVRPLLEGVEALALLVEEGGRVSHKLREVAKQERNALHRPMAYCVDFPDIWHVKFLHIAIIWSFSQN